MQIRSAAGAINLCEGEEECLRHGKVLAGQHLSVVSEVPELQVDDQLGLIGTIEESNS